MCSSSGGAQEKGKDKMKLSLHTKIVGKLVWIPVILFCTSAAFHSNFIICRNVIKKV
jgi:hypothetical protein